MFDRALEIGFKPIRWLIIALFSVMIGVTFLQVVFRYVFDAPLTWSEEVARYLFVWIVFLGAVLGLHRGMHIGVDLLTQRLSVGARRAVALFNETMIIVFCGIVVWASQDVLAVNAFQVSPAVGIVMAHVYAVIPLSMVLLAVVALKRMVDIARSRREE